MKQLHAIVDLQYGSTGKGLYAGWLAKRVQPDTIVTAWAPNAGHTFISATGIKMVNRSLPNGIVAANVKNVLIGPGSVIDPSQFLEELLAYQHLMDGVRLMIHEHAAVVEDAHRQMEARYAFKIGSTMKGVGEAVIQKIKRQPGYMNIARESLIGGPLEGYVVSRAEYNDALAEADRVLLEGAQGYSLGVNSGFYPYTTSRECTVAQLLSDCAIPMADIPSHGFVVHGVARTYPIRVSNRSVPNTRGGTVVYTSGPCYPDQREIDWKDLSREPELTTVTQLPRRVFTFSYQQIADACRANGVDEIFLNFCNYSTVPNSILHQEMLRDIAAVTGVQTIHTGWGPTEDDIQTAKVLT